MVLTGSWLVGLFCNPQGTKWNGPKERSGEDEGMQMGQVWGNVKELHTYTCKHTHSHTHPRVKAYTHIPSSPFFANVTRAVPCLHSSIHSHLLFTCLHLHTYSGPPLFCGRHLGRHARSAPPLRAQGGTRTGYAKLWTLWRGHAIPGTVGLCLYALWWCARIWCMHMLPSLFV